MSILYTFLSITLAVIFYLLAVLIVGNQQPHPFFLGSYVGISLAAAYSLGFFGASLTSLTRSCIMFGVFEPLPLS